MESHGKSPFLFRQGLHSPPNHVSWLVVSNIFYFHPYLGKIPILTNISNGLKPPTSERIGLLNIYEHGILCLKVECIPLT